MKFLSQDTGAVTVDWVVLTASIVGLGLAVMSVVSSGVEDLSSDVDTQLSQDDIIKTSFAVVYGPFDVSAYTPHDQNNFNLGYSQASTPFRSNNVDYFIRNQRVTRENNLRAAIAADDLPAVQENFDVLAGMEQVLDETGFEWPAITNETDMDTLYAEYAAYMDAQS